MINSPVTLNHALNQDAFSNVLDMLRLRGTSVATGTLSAGESLGYSESKPCIYVIQAGQLSFIAAPSDTTTDVQSGDVALMVRGEPHQLANVGEMPAQFIRGEFDFDSIFANRFLGTLPAVLLLERPGHKSHEWGDVCCAFMAFEAAHGYAGSTAMISRLLDLLFIRTLRSWASESRLGYGWVSCASDPRIGRVLTNIQSNPSRPWNLLQFADVAGMSRTAFASRFLEVIGQSPIAYLNQWRLDLAADLLRRQNLSISQLISHVGFTSETAFGRAFRLRHGQSPMQWRRARHLESP
jgi:AraC-like DNA-binding protein